MEASADQPKTVAKSALSFFSGTALSRISGLLRDMSIAYVFGTNAAIAAFLVALRLANLLRRIFGEGALLNSFIPHFETYRKENPKQAAEFFRDSFSSIFVILLILIGLIELLLSIFNISETNTQIIHLIAIILPGVIFICLFSLCSGLLQCEKNYFLTGISPVAFNAIWIASVWFLKDQSPDTAAVGLSIGVGVAFFFQWFITVPKTVSILRKSLSFKELFMGRIFTKEMRGMLSSLSISVIGVTAAQINTAIDTIFARFASLEGPAYLNYAIHIQQLPLALIGISISSALLPPLSRAIRSENFSQYKSLLEYSVRMAMFVIIPCTAGIFTAGGSCINLIFGRGHFDQISTYHTTLCLWGYGMGLIPMVLSLLLAPAFYAKKDYRTPLKASLWSILTNFILNFLFVVVFRQGPESLAISTSTAAYLNAAMLFKKTAVTFERPFFSSIAQIFVGSAFAGGITLGVGYFLLSDPTLPMILGSMGEYTRGFQSQLFEFGALFLSFVSSFLLFLVIAKNKEVYKILGLISNRYRITTTKDTEAQD